MNSNVFQPPTQPDSSTIRRHWAGLPITNPIEGTFEDVLNALPHFGRQPFAMASPNGNEVGINPFLDVVYKVPTRAGQQTIPVGIVSKNYRLVDHDVLLRSIQKALVDNELDSSQFQVRADWTVHGERAHFSILYPNIDLFRMTFGSPDDEMRFRIELFNSVEGSCRLLGIAGWLRFVCSNGLILGTAVMNVDQQHRQQLQVEELGQLVKVVTQSVQYEKTILDEWNKTPVQEKNLVRWVDEHVSALWGIKAAVRVLGISTQGVDGVPSGDIRNRRPSEIRFKGLNHIPGIDGPVRHVFSVSQVLSWIAGQRSDIAEQFEWRDQIPGLIAKLNLQ
jgi:hypothetical protein